MSEEEVSPLSVAEAFLLSAPVVLVSPLISEETNNTVLSKETVMTFPDAVTKQNNVDAPQDPHSSLIFASRTTTTN